MTWALAGAVGLADWKIGLADSGKAAEAVGLANSGQATIGSANFEVGSADSEQVGNPPLLLVGA